MGRAILSSILVLLLCGAVSASDLSGAMDTSLSFTTFGSADWFGQSSTFYNDGDAAQSGDVYDSQESWMQTTVSGEGTISFYWKVTSERYCDYLEFYIDGSVMYRISGSQDWQQMVYTLDSGSHTLEWRYFKDESVSVGNDCGWVDQVEWNTGSEPPPPPPSSGDFSEALDTTLIFFTGGSADWFAQSAFSYYDGDAAQSGGIQQNQESWIETTVDGTGTVSFYWKVSSEENYDSLEFYIDGVFQERINGSVNWQQKVYTINTSGSHTLKWRYIKDGSVSNDSDCGWLDLVEWGAGSEPPPPPPPPPSSELSEAMDTTLSFTTGGGEVWFGQDTSFYYGGDAAQSGDIWDNQESWMQTTLSGEGTLSFYWKVSSESYFDFLEFYIDDVLQDRISGLMDWQQMTYPLGSGSHSLKWLYIKDGSVSAGSDCGWIDQVEWNTGSEPPPPPPSSGDLSGALDTTLSFSTGGSVEWFAQSAFSYYDGDAAQSGTIQHNQESWIETIVDGAGTVSFYWKVSSEENYDSLEFYIDGVIQDQINGSVNWQQKVYTINSSGSHTLEWRYIKDGSVSVDNDCGWVDQVEWGAGSEPPPPPPPPPSSDLSEAMDTTLLFTTGGDADWFGQDTSFYYGGDAAQSGGAWDNQESWMQTTLLSGPATLSFYWKVSSESYCDFLEFYVDDVLQDRISGFVDWQQMTYTLGSGSHTLKWLYIKDGSVSAGSDCGWVDQVNWGDGSEPPPPPPSTDLSEAMDSTLSFATGGSANWFAQSVIFYYDADAAQSGDISNNDVSWVQTTVTGPGTVSFYWKVSSEGDYDFLGFYIDDVLQEQISGSVSWQPKMYTLGAGSHILEWRYTKDRSMDSGSDCGWVDQVEWETGSEPPPPPPPGDLSEALDTTLGFTTGGDADWFGQSTTTYYGGDAAQSGDILHNMESWMQTTVNGQTTVSFYWKVSSEINSDFLEFYIDDEFQDRISGDVDWQQETYILDSLGIYKLDWKYIKDGSVSTGSDCGWVDKLEWEGGSEPPPPPPPPSDDLSDALDTTLIFTTGGDAVWFGQFVIFNYGEDAAQSGAIASNQESWMQTTVSGPTTMSFYWKVSSEGGYDYLEFYIDGERQERISGSTDWQQMVYELDSGSHTLEWRYTKDMGVDNGSDCGWVDQVVLGGDVEPPPPPPSSDLSEAMDTTLSFTTGGSAAWVGQFSTYYFGEDAAQSGGIWHNQESWIQTTLSGPTTVSFYWKASSESYYDYLGFYIDGVIKEQISGETDWQPVVYTIPAGLHTLKWRYVKDGSVSIGSDRGWVDLVEWGTDPGNPPPSVDLIEALDTPFSFTTGGSANWFGQTETSYFDGDAAQSGPISDSQTTWLRTAIEVTEDKAVSFYWKVSSEVGYDYLEFYIDGELQDRITGIGDWEHRTYTILFPYAFGSQTYTFEWRYVKDSSVGAGSDCGWVDMVK